MATGASQGSWTPRGTAAAVPPESGLGELPQAVLSAELWLVTQSHQLIAVTTPRGHRPPQRGHRAAGGRCGSSPEVRAPPGRGRAEPVPARKRAEARMPAPHPCNSPGHRPSAPAPMCQPRSAGQAGGAPHWDTRLAVLGLSAPAGHPPACDPPPLHTARLPCTRPPLTHTAACLTHLRPVLVHS